MKKQAALALGAIVLAACASTGPTLSPEDRLQLYRGNSDPVGTFRIDNRAGRVIHWSAINDQALTVMGFSAQPYLLELRNRCSGLTFATSVALSNSFGTVAPGFDSVQPLSAGRQVSSPSCRIATARRINQGGLKQAKRDLKDSREASLVERDPEAKPDDGKD